MSLGKTTTTTTTVVKMTAMTGRSGLLTMATTASMTLVLTYLHPEAASAATAATAKPTAGATRDSRLVMMCQNQPTGSHSMKVNGSWTTSIWWRTTSRKAPTRRPRSSSSLCHSSRSFPWRLQRLSTTLGGCRRMTATRWDCVNTAIAAIHRSNSRPWVNLIAMSSVVLTSFPTPRGQGRSTVSPRSSRLVKLVSAMETVMADPTAMMYLELTKGDDSHYLTPIRWICLESLDKTAMFDMRVNVYWSLIVYMLQWKSA